MSNARVLVEQFLTQLACIRYVKTIPALVMEHCLSPSS